ncbi:hypothetical protein [Pontibacter sp. SGAir0037]|uniref:pirin family protein n=1 Tax=Pontibacter sp. SGAir0037 TaxID=2571030 RepID=UPI0010CCD1F2|nr:hypothetical protein [Pontibacter sp. SGAir0037]QCR22516.1 hypothetical protein C1N53_09325 [Pontibacter sp. SGAir0037]
MTKETPGKIFLADQHYISETAILKRCSTFPSEAAGQEDRQPFRSLYLLNEELLAAYQSVNLEVKQDSYLVLIPITGEVNFLDCKGHMETLDVEEVQVHHVSAGYTYQISNPYKTDNITFLQLWMKATAPVAIASPDIYTYTIGRLHNNLANIVTNARFPFRISMGRFDGRQEAVYKLQNKTSALYAYALSGVFEVEGRLLHEKDGIALWDTAEVELEALSHNALILFLELI